MNWRALLLERDRDLAKLRHGHLTVVLKGKAHLRFRLHCSYLVFCDFADVKLRLSGQFYISC